MSRHRLLVVPMLTLLLASACTESRAQGAASPLPAQAAPGVALAPQGAVALSPAQVRVEGTLSLDDGFAPAVAKVVPAVVSVFSTKIVRAPRFPGFPFGDPFSPFDGMGEGRPQKELGLGSGVIVSADGIILTNNHVVQDASELRVKLGDGRDLKAKVLGADPKTDIAVIKIDAKDLPHVPLGDSAKVRVGEFALAIGNPFGIGQTVTLGIISATKRGNVGIVDYEDFLQTDAAINPGNSGGALINSHGELIGINTAILSRSGGNQGIGLAVPSQIARQVMDQIVKSGKVVRGWLGVAIQDVTPDMADALNLKDARGALVGDVTEGSPAAQAGLKRGDVVVQLEGVQVESSRALRTQISQSSPGAKVKLGVLRGGSRVDVTVTLGELPEKLGRTPGTAEPEKLGVEVGPITPDVARQLDIPAGLRGVVVTRVAEGSRASDSGLKPGDVVLEVNQKPVANPRDFASMVEKVRGKNMVLLVWSGGTTGYVLLPPSD